MKAIGMHIFAGGFTLGMKRHHEVLAHLEDGDYGVETVRLNQPEIPVYTEPDEWPLERLFERGAKLVYGNPPCAPFSGSKTFSSSHAKDPMKDPRVESIRQMIDVLERYRPRFWVFESVCGAYKKGGPILARVERVAESIGHNVTHFLHNVNYHGTAQRRLRYFCIVHDAPIRWTAPDWDEAPTAGDVLKGVEDPGEEITPGPERWAMWEPLLPELPPGKRLRYVFDRVHPDPEMGRPLANVQRLEWNKPCKTVMGHFRFVHPKEDRFLTVRERAALMGFPPDYAFSPEGANAKCDETSRGVCVSMADYLGRLLKQAAAGKPETQGVMEVDFRDPPGSIKFVRSY